jgi:hypothetical protein
MSSLPTIERFLRDHESGAYFERLVNRPAPHPRRTTPELFYYRHLHPLEPRFTVVTPTFNAASMIAAQMNATAGAASLPFDWILIDDGSDDGTPEIAKAIFESTPPLVARATIVRNPVPVFETACDNIGFSLAETEVVVEVQSDIQIREQGFDALILCMLSMRPRPAAISGRCGHSFFGLRGRVVRALLGGRDDECIGLCGPLIDTPEVVDSLKGAIYRCETVPRGPWVVLKSDLERAGYLDERTVLFPRQRRPRLPPAPVRGRGAASALRADVVALAATSWRHAANPQRPQPGVVQHASGGETRQPGVSAFPRGPAASGAPGTPRLTPFSPASNAPTS